MKLSVKSVLICGILSLFLLIPGKITAAEESTQQDTYNLNDYNDEFYDGQSTLSITEKFNSDTREFDAKVPIMTKVTTITLSEDARNIPFSLFQKCPNVKKIVIGKDVTMSPFLCNLNGFKQLNSITVESGNSDFKAVNNVLYSYDKTSILAYPKEKKDSTYVMPSTVKEHFDVLGENVYLKQVTLSKSYSDYDSVIAAKNNLPKLETIKVASGNKRYKAVNGILYTYSGKTLLFYPNGKKNSTYTVPSTVTNIKNCFGNNKYLKTLVLGKRVSYFARPYSANIVILPNLTNVKLAAGNKHYSTDKGVLYNSGHKELIYCPKGKTAPYTTHSRTRVIRARAFENCKITKVTLQKGITTIGENAFRNTPLKSIAIPSTVTKLNGFSNEMNALKTITVRKGCKNFYAKDGILYNQDSTIKSWPNQCHVTKLYFTSDKAKKINLTTYPNLKYVETLYIGKNVSYVKLDNQNLKRIVLNSDNKSYHLFDGVLYNADYSKIVLYPNCNPNTTVTLYKDLKVLNQRWFTGTNTTKKLILPDALTTFYLYYNSSCENTTAPAGYEHESGIDKYENPIVAFHSSRFQNLEELTISDENPYFTCVDNVLYRKDMKILYWYPVARTNSEYTLPDSCVKLTGQLREMKHLKKLTLNTTVKSTVSYLGMYSDSLEEIVVPETNPWYASVDGALYRKDMTRLIVYPNGKHDTSYTMPDTVTIACFTKSNKYLKEITLSAALSEIVRDTEFSDEELASYTSAGVFFGFDNLEQVNGLKPNVQLTIIE